MGRTRRLWYRLRGIHDGKVQVAVDATGDSGGCTPQSPVTTAAEPDLATGRDDKVTAKEIWLDAYKKLGGDEDTKNMVLAYETLLSEQLNGSMIQLGVGTNSSFSGCQTPEDKISAMQKVTEVTLEKASRHNERKEGFVKAAKVINTIGSAVIKPMLQTEAVASLAWAGVCVALEFAIRATTAGIDMVDGLCHVAKRMEWYMLLHTLLLQGEQLTASVNTNQRAGLRDCLRKSIQDLYYNLLMYEIQCVCYCYRENQVTKSLRALVTLDDWKGRLNDIKQLESGIQMDVSQFAQIQAKDRLNKVAQDADERFHEIDRILYQLLVSHEQTSKTEEARSLEELVGWLSISDYNRHMKLNETRVPRTCEWFCHHETFKEWLSTDAGLLLVSADPGCGKSTLARYLIEEVLPLQNDKNKVLYFFFKDTKEHKRLSTAICAVLHQLLLDNNDLVSTLASDIRQAGVQIRENSSKLCNLFTTACQNSTDQIICVFDALDECDPGESPELIRYIKDILANDIEIKFLVTTRGYPQLLNQFRDFASGLIHLDGDGKQEKDAIQQEINLVLDYKLDHLSKMKSLDKQPEKKAAIEKALRSKGSEQRTYMWLKLVFDIMERIPWKSDNDWKKVIMSPPQTVNDAYATLLQNVPDDEKVSVKVLLHLIVAASRPLTLREMNIALLVRDSPGAHDEKSLGLQSENEFKDWILQTCGFFITVYDNRLSFIHQTAKEFLVGSGLSMLWPQGPDQFSSVTDEAAHKIMAESSIAYLSLKCFNSRQFQERAQRVWADRHGKMQPAFQDLSQYEASLRNDYGFLEYTTEYWVTHFKLCQSFDGSNFMDVGDEFIPHYIVLFTPCDCVAPGWMLMHFMYHRDNLTRKQENLAGRYEIGDATLWFDHTRLLVYNLGHNTYTNEFLLHTAAALNAANCVQYLVAAGHDINAQDQSGATALCFAARNRSSEAMGMLLDYNADVNLSEGPDKMPLSDLVQRRSMPERMKLVQRVVCQGADLNNTIVMPLGIGTATMTPLAWASQIAPSGTFGNEGHTQRLDAWILEKFDSSGFRKVGDLLQNMDLFAADEFLDAYNGSLVKLLLDHGADINGAVLRQFPEGHAHREPMTALEHACHYVSSKVSTDDVFWNAVFLLHSGANSRLNAEIGSCALDWLIRAPPEVESMERSYTTHTPLGLSWKRCHALAVLLLKHNAASSYINNPISSNTVQTRLHLLTASHNVRHRRNKIKLLLDHGAGTNYQDVQGKTPMHHLVSHTSGKVELRTMVSMLIAKGAELDARDSLGRTPMHYVRSTIVIHTLVQNGADIEARDREGNTPLQVVLACCGAEVGPEIAQTLIAIGADTTVSNYAGETLLHTAATSGFAEGLLTLLQARMDLDIADCRGETPLQAALNHRCHAAAALLLARGADVTPLIERKFDVEQRDWRTGVTLLVFVSEAHAHGAVRTLLRRGANPNVLPTVEESDVERYLDRLDCIQNGKDWFVKLEMLRTQTRKSRVSEPNQPWHHIKPSHQNGRPLHLAMRNGWTRNAEITVDLLLRHGADINARSGLGQTPLQVACHHGNEQGVRVLLKHGAHAYGNAPRWDDTPLGMLCQAWQPNPGLIRALVTHGGMSDPGCLDGPDLWKISHSWSNSASDSEGTSCRREGDPHALSHDVTGPEYQSKCQCRECCRDHESRACAAVQTMLDAGAWVQLRKPLQKADSWTKDIDTPRYWGWENLATLLEQETVPKWRRAWMPPNTRRRSWPAAKPTSFHPNTMNQATGEEDSYP